MGTDILRKGGGKLRQSNFELYRIMCMLMIIAFHYVVHSGLGGSNGLINQNKDSFNSIYLMSLGSWGKVGINCFLMITGYFMCTQKITIRKFLKLLFQVVFTNIVIFIILFATGYEGMDVMRILRLFVPIYNLGHSNFVGCFLVFYLTIPFLNALIHSLSERSHFFLVVLFFIVYSVCGSFPGYDIPYNYITWFGIIYLFSSFIRLYPRRIFEGAKKWGFVSLFIVVISILSMPLMNKLFGAWYYLLVDCNKLFAVAFAVSSFLWFKNLKIKHNKIINALGASTFGVYLIHDNCEAMREWLWEDTVKSVASFQFQLPHLIIYSVLVIVVIFITCCVADMLRLYFFERPFLKWYDKYF